LYRFRSELFRSDKGLTYLKTKEEGLITEMIETKDWHSREEAKRNNREMVVLKWNISLKTKGPS
jgi:hypothetical protein